MKPGSVQSLTGVAKGTQGSYAKHGSIHMGFSIISEALAKLENPVTPAKAGVQKGAESLDSRSPLSRGQASRE